MRSEQRLLELHDTEQHGADCQNDGCRSNSDCCGGICQGPNSPPLCGVCQMMMSNCSSNSDCMSGQVCQSSAPPPCDCVAGGVLQTCEAACTSTSCGSGMQCATDGTCVPVPCGHGYQCPALTDCRPDAGGDPHGCTLRPCTTDSDCSEGVCVEGDCSASPGMCELAVP